MWVLIHLMVFHKFLFFNFFILFHSFFWLPIALVHWSFLLLNLVWCWTTLLNFSVQLLYSSALWFLSFHMLFLLRFSVCIFIVLLISVSIFRSVMLNSFSDKSFVSFPFRSFSGVVSYSFVYNRLVLLNFPFLCWCMCIRKNRYLFKSWQSGLMKGINLIVYPSPSSWLFLKTFCPSHFFVLRGSQ